MLYADFDKTAVLFLWYTNNNITWLMTSIPCILLMQSILFMVNGLQIINKIEIANASMDRMGHNVLTSDCNRENSGHRPSLVNWKHKLLRSLEIKLLSSTWMELQKINAKWWCHLSTRSLWYDEEIHFPKHQPYLLCLMGPNQVVWCSANHHGNPAWYRDFSCLQIAQATNITKFAAQISVRKFYTLKKIPPSVSLEPYSIYLGLPTLRNMISWY